MYVYKRGQSLKDLLCRAKLPNSNRRSKRVADQKGFRNCGQLCNLCPFAKAVQSHQVAEREFQINGLITCSTTGCVYKILCGKCLDFVYYGETGRALRTRFAEHIRDIRKAKAKPVAEHFNMPGHDLDDVAFIGIEKVMPPGDTFLRKQRESYYIRRGNAVHVGGNRRF